MKNYAGRDDVDAELQAELEAAGIPAQRYPLFALERSEVASGVVGELHGWVFRRAWVYWVAKGPGLPPAYADALHQEHGATVRVDGDCTSPSPLEQTKGFGVGLYHVDDEKGLLALANTLKRCAAEAGLPAPSRRFPVGSKVWVLFVSGEVAEAVVSTVVTWEQAGREPAVSYLFEPGTQPTYGQTGSEAVFATEQEARAEQEKRIRRLRESFR